MRKELKSVEYTPLKAAHIELIRKQPYDQPVFINLMTNCHKGGYTTGCSKKDLLYYNIRLKHLNVKTDREHIGRHFLKDEHQHLRQKGIIKPENIKSNLHYHGRVDIGKWNIDEYRKFVEHHWRRLAPEGTVKVLSEFDAQGLGVYISKDEHEQSLKSKGGIEIFWPY